MKTNIKNRTINKLHGTLSVNSDLYSNLIFIIKQTAILESGV